MSKIYVSMDYCSSGDILAEDIYNGNGITLVSKNTVINGFIKHRLESLGVNNVWIYQPLEIQEKILEDRKHTKFKNSYKKTIIMVKEILLELSSGGTIDYNQVDEIVSAVYDNMNEKTIIIQSLAELKDSDEYTYTHCVNVALYSMLIAKWLDFSEMMVREVILAGLLHDIGKVKIPIEILNKKGKLTSEEFDLIKRHPDYGYEIISDKIEITNSISLGIKQHHERIDGSGYPDKLKGDDIGAYGKVVAVADVYDAMTQNRVYKKGVAPFEAFEMFLMSGIRKFDVDIISVFLKYLPAYFTGAMVLLSNGEKGKIVYVPPIDILHPVIQVKGNFVDLSKEKEIKISAILGKA